MILDSLLAGYLLGPDVALSSLATQTAALVAGDLSNLIMHSRLTAIERVAKSSYVLFLCFRY